MAGRKFAIFAILYLCIGIIFAICFALFYHWAALSFLSPGFYVVILTWPAQIPGFFIDFQTYGLAGKVLF